MNSWKPKQYKKCAPFIDFISEINNTQVDNATDIDIVLPIYNLIKYSDIYFKAPRSLWQCYRGKPFLDDNGTIGDFPVDDNNTVSFKVKTKIVGRAENDGIEDVEIRVP